MSKSNRTANQVEVIKRVNLGHVPLFLQLAHKGLEKSCPEGENHPQGGQQFTIAKDLLSISVANPAVLDEVERIDVVYQKG
jgi:hypothetical protein